MEKRFFTTKNLVLMTIFGTLSSLATLTTAFIPAPLPGLYAIVAIPVSTILVLTARDIVGRTGAATFTQLVSGMVSTLLHRPISVHNSLEDQRFTAGFRNRRSPLQYSRRSSLILGIQHNPWMELAIILLPLWIHRNPFLSRRLDRSICT